MASGCHCWHVCQTNACSGSDCKLAGPACRVWAAQSIRAVIVMSLCYRSNSMQPQHKQHTQLPSSPVMYLRYFRPQALHTVQTPHAVQLMVTKEMDNAEQQATLLAPMSQLPLFLTSESLCQSLRCVCVGPASPNRRELVAPSTTPLKVTNSLC